MRRALIGAVSAIVSMSMMSSTASADCGEVTMTEMDWASSQVVTAVAKFIMEQGYGCKVTTVPSATETAITSLVETGTPDVVTELWINATPAYDKLEAEGKVKTATRVLSDGGVEGWWIPKYVADKHPELKTVQDAINNPELVGGVFHNCPDGWVCKKFNDNVAKALNMKEKMEIFNHGGSETLAASIASAYADKKPWFGYYWAPTAILGKYPMVKLSLGPHKPDVYQCNTKGDECDTPGVTDFATAKVITAVTTDMAQKNPAIFELMQKLSFTNAQLGEILAWKEDNKASSEEAAAHFLKKYKSVWANWLNDDAKKKLAVLLK